MTFGWFQKDIYDKWNNYEITVEESHFIQQLKKFKCKKTCLKKTEFPKLEGNLPYNYTKY